MYGNIQIRMLNWTSLTFLPLPYLRLSPAQSHSHCHSFRFLFLSIWGIYVLANYPNAMVIAESGLWDHSSLTSRESTVLLLNGWRRRLDLTLPWVPPSALLTSCVPAVGCAFDVQILQVGHKPVYNGPVLVHVKINILFCVPGWQDATILLAFAKSVLGPRV